MTDCKKILIVETDQITRRGICSFIKEMRPDWEVHEAENGYEALEIAEQETIDNFTIDYYLPGLTGLELIIELKRMHTRGKIVLLTAPLPNHLKTEIEAISVAHIDKPITEDTIVSALKYFDK